MLNFNSVSELDLKVFFFLSKSINTNKAKFEINFLQYGLFIHNLSFI